MIQIGIQSKNIVTPQNPMEGFELIQKAGFSCVDFSLNEFLTNNLLYDNQKNSFFEQSIEELIKYFHPYLSAVERNHITINQMHLPYPLYVPNGKDEINDYLRKHVAPKSIEICNYFNCSYLVLHGFKMARILGSEEAEWEMTEEFIDYLAPLAIEKGVVLCLENLYSSFGGHLIEGPCCNASKVIERIDRINNKYNAEVLGFCFDTGHANIVGMDDESFLVKLGNRLKVLHIHDNDGISDLHQLPYTFSKSRDNNPSTDWNGFLNGLKRINYSHVLSFETAPVLSTFPDKMKEAVLEFIHSIGVYMKHEIEGSDER